MAGAVAKARKTHHGDSASQASARHTNGSRVSTGSHDVTSDADEDEEEEEVATQKSSEKANGKRKRAQSKHDSDDTEEEDVMAESQPTTASAKKKDRDGSLTEMGIIEEIYCENFMCHRKLRVELSPHINFITGENGSGKSAIIAAIQICLGASARSTHRGKSIKNLIRHGHDGNALVRITLRNDGETAAKGSDAFRAETFGKRIMVERLIRRDGSAEYRLKNEYGILVSKLKSDLDAMLDHLNIQTENPCAILDQENAKLFLKGNPTDKYKFFLQSTDLYKMRNTYAKIDEETRAMADSVLRREKAKLVSLKEAMNEAVQRWEEAQSIGQLEEEFAQVKKELAWSFVHEKEIEAARVAKKKKMKERDEAEIREKYQEVFKLVAALEAKQKEKNAKLQQIMLEVRDVQARNKDARNRVREARRPLHAHQAELKQIHHARERTQQRIQRLQRDIENKRRSHETMLQSKMRRNDEMLDKIERKRYEIEQISHDLEGAKRQAAPEGRNSPLDELDYQHDRCVRQLRDAESEIHRVQGRINGLKAQKRDSLAVFGHKIPQLQQLIHENMHRFAAPPIGPLGMHVKLPERYMNFAVGIEVALKGSLQSYLVVNGKDKALLDDLKRQIKCPPNQAAIIIAKRSGRRYTNLRLPEGELAAHAICNILDVSNDEVFNALIDVCSTESKLLFENRETAEKMVLRGASGSFRSARNVSEVYMPDGDKFVVRGGNLAYIANKGQRRSSIICQDVDGEINELEHKLEYLQGNCEVLRRDDARMRHEKENLAREMRHYQDRVNDLTRRYNQRRVELRNLEEELADDVQQNTLDTSVLEEEINEAERELRSQDAREVEVQNDLSKFNPDLEGMMKEIDDLTSEEKELTQDMAEQQEDVDAVYKHLSEVKVQELRYEREAATASEFVAQWDEHLRAIRAECEELSAKAQAVCGSSERIEVSETHDYYGKRLTDIKRKIDKERGRFQGMDLNDLLMDKEEKTLKYKSKKTTYDLFSSNLKQVRSMLEERQQVWQVLRREIAHRTSMGFNDFMGLNNFAGKLKFRHDDQRLEIAVLRNEKGLSRHSQVTDMKELSGGERSYTQVSLLLALGESIECPFRVMDEFDVFMDSVNRDMTIQLLVDAAKKESRKQFIFVTPNDLSALRRDSMVKIQKMNPPRDRLNAEANM